MKKILDLNSTLSPNRHPYLFLTFKLVLLNEIPTKNKIEIEIETKTETETDTWFNLWGVNWKIERNISCSFGNNLFKWKWKLFAESTVNKAKKYLK